MKKRSARFKCRVGDIVAISLAGNQFGFARIMQDCDLAIYDTVASTPQPDIDWSSQSIRLHTAFFTDAVRSGEWPIIGHVEASHPDDDWAPPVCSRDYFPPHDVRYIVHKGVWRRATNEEAAGMEDFCMRDPLGVVILIETQILGLPPRPRPSLPVPNKNKKKKSVTDVASFANDDASDLLGELERARTWSRVRGALTKAAKARPQAVVEAPEARRAVAAAALVALAHGYREAWIPDDATEFVERVGAPEPELVELSERAVARVFEASELKELWEDSSQFPAWQTAISDLTNRLSRCRN